MPHQRSPNEVLSDRAARMEVMTEIPPARQAPPRRSDTVQVSDFTMLVHVPGQPAAVRVFTDDEQDEAHGYAAATGGTVVPLPLPMPEGVAEVVR